MDNRIGQQLGNYRLVDLLGRGALTKVYLGEHVHLNTLAAIKVLDASSSDTNFIFWFKREAGVIAKLVHPNIIRVLEFDVVQGSIAFLVVTYAPRGTFPRNYPKGSRLSSTIILPYVKRLCSALQYAHNWGAVHGDIRSEHILLGDNDEVLLDHFGSQLLKKDLSAEARIADMNVYRAPEQLSYRISPASDQYALGVVVYEWLCGKPPFEGNTWEIIKKMCYKSPPPLRETMPTIPLAIEQVVLKALAKDPQQRFSSIEGFANAFEHACSLELATPSPSTKLQSVSPFPTSLEGSASTKGMKLFFSYSHKDERLRNKLAKRLALLKRNGLISDWYDRNIDAGAEWAREVDTHLNQADIILLLVSPDFIASDYCYNLEMMRALERHEAGEASVIPIILRPVSWKETPFGKLQALPTGDKAVTTWSNRDQAFLQIAEGIQKIVEKSNKKRD